MYFATSGSEVVATPFTAIINGETPREKQRREDREFYERLAGALASREQIETFTKELDRLDAASTAALLENEEKLRIARKELQQIRERAYELTRPDGTVTKVYRDGEIVRDDDGSEVNSTLIKPQDIPDSLPTWEQRKTAGAAVVEAEKEYKAVVEYRERLEKLHSRLDKGNVTDKELGEMKMGAERMPDSVRAHYERLTGDRTSGPVQPASTFASEHRPTRPFAKVASGTVLDATPDADLDFKALPPSAASPAPR